MTSGVKNSNPPQLFICQYCQSNFSRVIYPSIPSNPLFCSSLCRNKIRILKDVSCPVCETMFKPNINGANRVRKKHCSSKCASISRLGIGSQNKTPQYIIDEIICRYPTEGANLLMEEFGLKKSTVQQIAYNAGVKLISSVYRERVHEAARQHMLTNNPIKGKYGPNNPLYTGGRKACDRGPNWKQQREIAKDRDNHKCQNCGEKEGIIDVHHIIHFDEFNGDWESANHLDNLLTLCRKCHVRLTRGLLMPTNPSEISPAL